MRRNVYYILSLEQLLPIITKKKFASIYNQIVNLVNIDVRVRGSTNSISILTQGTSNEWYILVHIKKYFEIIKYFSFILKEITFNDNMELLPSNIWHSHHVPSHVFLTPYIYQIHEGAYSSNYIKKLTPMHGKDYVHDNVLSHQSIEGNLQIVNSTAVWRKVGNI